MGRGGGGIEMKKWSLFGPSEKSFVSILDCGIFFIFWESNWSVLYFSKKKKKFIDKIKNLILLLLFIINITIYILK